MNAYDAFASAYDALNTEIDYEQMADFIAREFESAGIVKGSLVLDLGCGTGTLTRLLAGLGYDMIGVDGSGEMLACAREKGGDGVLYLEQQLDGFELYGTVAAIVSTTDTLNHVLDDGELRRVFDLAHNYTDPGGLFIFDLNSALKFETVYRDRNYILEDDGVMCCWRNCLSKKGDVADFYLTVFTEKDGVWVREDGIERERAWGLRAIENALRRAGMELWNVSADYRFTEPDADTDRWYLTAGVPL